MPIETPGRIEPALIEDAAPALTALATDLAGEAPRIGAGLHPEVAAALAEIVRGSNAFHSNLMEGHVARPEDIDQSLAVEDIPLDRRDLALEARAHVTAQREIDEALRHPQPPVPTSSDFIRNVHRRFYEQVPAEFGHVIRADGARHVLVPGLFRQSPADDVAVGRHTPPSSERVSAFMDHFEKRYSSTEKWSSSARIMAIAPAHHRFGYIHPFPDGNGRVGRLMSHAMAQRAGIGGHGLWSISRGLARGLKDRSEYKRMMDHADTPRQGDLDGRGNLSARALRDFSEWFMLVMLDQIRFSTIMFDLDRLEERYRQLASDLIEDPMAPDLIGTVLRHGAPPTNDGTATLQPSHRGMRCTISDLISAGLLETGAPGAPPRIAFPAAYREELFPDLFIGTGTTPPQSPPPPGRGH